MKKTLLTAGVDVGGTKVQTAIVLNGEVVVGKGRKPTGIEKAGRTGEDFMNAILGALVEGCRNAKVTLDRLEAIGVGSAGQIEPGTGDVLDSPHLPWGRRFPLKKLIERATGKPVTIVNDVQAASWGEYVRGAGKNSRKMVCIFVGTGIGSGIVIDGRLYRGAGGSAGEVGHSHFKLNGLKCQCGRRGCAEAYGGGESLWRRARNAIKRGAKSRIYELVNGDLDHIPASVVHRAAVEGDPLAKRLWRDVELAIGVVCHNYVDMLNPDMIVLGGGVVNGVPELRRFARRYVDGRAVPSSARAVKIVAPKLGNLSPAFGAADLAYRAVTGADADEVAG